MHNIIESYISNTSLLTRTISTHFVIKQIYKTSDTIYVIEYVFVNIKQYLFILLSLFPRN